MTAAGKDRERLAREQRLAAALRDNLKRRKVQSRARSAPETVDPPKAAGRPEANGPPRASAATDTPTAPAVPDGSGAADPGGQASGAVEQPGSGSHDSAGIVTEKQSGIDG